MLWPTRPARPSCVVPSLPAPNAANPPPCPCAPQTLNTTLTDTKAKLDAATSDKNKLATQVDQLVNTPCNQKFVGTTQTNASLRTDCEIVS